MLGKKALGQGGAHSHTVPFVQSRIRAIKWTLTKEGYPDHARSEFYIMELVLTMYSDGHKAVWYSLTHQGFDPCGDDM